MHEFNMEEISKVSGAGMEKDEISLIRVICIFLNIASATESELNIH